MAVSKEAYHLPVSSLELVNCNVLFVEAGTNCPQGGDTGHGGLTVLRLEDCASTDMRVRIKPKGWNTTTSPLIDVESVELIFGGDTEHQTLCEALEFALAVLKRRQK